MKQIFSTILGKVTSIKLNTDTIKNIIIGCLIVFCILSFKKCNKNASTLDEYKTVLALKDQKIKEWIDKDGRNHAQIQEISASKEVIEAVYKQKLDSVAKILGVKNKQIKEYVEIIAKTSGSGSGSLEPIIKYDTVWKEGKSTLVRKTDTLGYKLVIDSTKDKYLDFEADITKGLTYTYKYTYKDKMSYTKVVKHTGFLGLKKETFLDFSYDNPNTKIIGAQQFKISDIEKKKRFGVGPYAGYTFDGTQFKPSFGIAIQYSIIRF